MTSIAHRIAGQITLAKLGIYFQMDLLFFILFNAGWAYMKELELLGDFAFRRHRDLALENGVLTGLSYRVYSMDGERLMAVDFFDTVFRIAVFVAALFVLQLIGLLFSAPVASARAHRTLRPIREMAEKMGRDGRKFVLAHFDWKVIVTNPYAVSEMEENKKQEFFRTVQGIVEDQSIDDQQAQKQVQEAQEYYNYNWQDLREIRANELVHHYSKELNFKQIFI